MSQSAYALFNGVGKAAGARGRQPILNAGAPWQSAPGNGLGNLHRHRRTQDQSRATGALLNIPLSKAVRFQTQKNSNTPTR
jgi:hypothetical protein